MGYSKTEETVFNLSLPIAEAYGLSLWDVEFKKELTKLSNINWNRANEEWYLRAINKTGRVITNKKAVLLIANHIKTVLGIELNENELAEENALAEMRGEN